MRRRRQHRRHRTDPIVIATLTRTGSTLLQRLLNVHPDVTIWGEHFGMLTHLRHAHDVIRSSEEQLRAGSSQRDLLLYGRLGPDVDLHPQVNPFTLEDLDELSRRFVSDLLAARLPSDRRWGFKEVHYFGNDVAFLTRLFPDLRLIVLVRRPQDQISSYVRAPWRSYPDRRRHPDEWTGAIEHAVAGAAREWTARFGELARTADALGDRAITVRYEDLRSLRGIDAVFAHCGVEPPGRRELAAVVGHRALSSDDSPGWDDPSRSALDEIIATFDPPDDMAEIVDVFYGTPTPSVSGER